MEESDKKLKDQQNEDCSSHIYSSEAISKDISKSESKEHPNSDNKVHVSDDSRETENSKLNIPSETESKDNLSSQPSSDDSSSRKAEIEEALRLKDLGGASYKLKDFHAAVSHYEAAAGLLAPSLPSELAKIHSNLCICFLKLDQPEAAISHADIALKLNPGWGKVLGNRAEAALRLNRYEESFRDFSELEKIDPSLINPSRYIEAKTKSEAEFERKKKEVMGQLKDLGNSLLGKFGMSLDNFNFAPSPNGGYNINFKNN